MTGRKPKPIGLVARDGDTRKYGTRKLAARIASEPQATRGLPPCPEHLTGRARDAWEFLAAEIADMGLDRRPDALMLEGACASYARAVEADLIVERDGLVIENSTIDAESGEKIVLKVRAHPAIAVSNAAWQQVRSFSAEFGLSPAARARVVSERKEPTEDLAAILSAPREPRPAVQ